MTIRNLKHHQLVKVGSSEPGMVTFILRDHPEVEILAYQGGRGNRNAKGWQIKFNGCAPSEHYGHNGYESNFEQLDASLLHFGDCVDCGRFAWRTLRDDGHRCSRCHKLHEQRKTEYRDARHAARQAEIVYDRIIAIRSAPTAMAACMSEMGWS